MRLVSHTIVKNEENFVWYAINSAMDYVDEMLIWDTGSTDNTVQIIKEIKKSKNGGKIKFREIGKVDTISLAKARQAMIDETKANWIFILDGDEVWHEESIESQVKKIGKDGDKFDLIVNPNKMLIGDIYHYQDDKAGEYKIHDKTGHYNIRFIKNLPGLKVEGGYPNEAYVYRGVKVQDFPKNRIYFSETCYLHASFLPRSSRDEKKVKYEIGIPYPVDYFYPEVFFKDRPGIVPSPWKAMSGKYKLRAYIETPLKKIKRGLLR